MLSLCQQREWDLVCMIQCVGWAFICPKNTAPSSDTLSAQVTLIFLLQDTEMGKVPSESQDN